MAEAHAGRLFDHVRAYVLDPDGTNMEAVFNGPVEWSTGSVVFTWESA